MNFLLEMLFGPRWLVTVSYRVQPPTTVTRIVRAKTEFDAKWKAAEWLKDNNAQVGYLAYKWMNNLYLDETESIEASRVPYEAGRTS